MTKRVNSIKYIFIYLVISCLITTSCKKKNDNAAPISTTGKLTIKMNNEVSGQPVTFGQLIYTNASGSLYRIDLLKYYISNFTLIKDDNTENNFANYKLINAADTTTCNFSFDSVANGSYTAVRFYLGVDSARNHTGAQTGDLDPINGMIWTWNTGYMFFKHEGGFINDTGGTSPLTFHYGTDIALATVDIPVTKFDIKGDNHILYLKFDLNKLYDTPTVMTFNNSNIHESTLALDMPWIYRLKGNFPGAFSFDKVQ